MFKKKSIMKKIWSFMLIAALAAAPVVLSGCSDDDNGHKTGNPGTGEPGDGGDGGGDEPGGEPSLDVIEFETLGVETDYLNDAFGFSPLDQATIILCGEGYATGENAYGIEVPVAGKYIRIELNIPLDSNKLIPEGTYPVIDMSKVANTDYKPMTSFQYYTADIFEYGTFYRDTDAEITFSGNEEASTVTITASTTVQDGYRIVVDLKDDTTQVKAEYEGVVKF